MAPPVPPDFNQLISAAISSKGGSDFSSNTMDPIMQYLNGTYQQAPQFDVNQLYERTAPTFMSAASLGDSSPHAIAAARIKSGQAPWELWRDRNLQQQSGMSPEEWKSFINDLAGEQQTVKKAMLDQGLQQDVFQRAGMHGANASYTDVNPDGTSTYASDAYQYAPKQFDELLSNLPNQVASDSARRQAINTKYAAPVYAKTEAQKLAQLEGEFTLQPIQQRQLDSYQLQPDVQAEMLKRMRRDSGQRALDKAGSGRVFFDKRLSAIGRSDANAINAYMDRKQGSAVNTQRQAADLAQQILMSLAQQGATPLKTDIMKNAMLKRSTRNG